MTGECLLLDLDGTLADTAPDLGASLNRVLMSEGRLPLSFAEIRPVVSNGSWAMIRAGFDLGPDDADAERLRQLLLDDYVENIHVETALFPGFDELLQNLERVGTPWGVMTNKPSRYTNPLMRSMQLDTRAACIVSADEVARAKPAPDGLIEAARLAGIAADRCVYVGDAARDIQCAHAAGMPALGALWGYIEDDDDPATWGADALIDRPADIAAFLSGL